MYRSDIVRMWFFLGFWIAATIAGTENVYVSMALVLIWTLIYMIYKLFVYLV